MVQIAVTGEATARVAAERGRVALRIEADGETRADVVARAAAQHAEVVAEARSLVASGAATEWEAADVTTGTFWEWVEGTQQQVRRFRAQARVHVTFRDFAALGTWCLEVAGREDVVIDHVAWDLTRERRASTIEELRAGAARDAGARASSYAAALGLPAPRLTALYEDGLRPGAGAGGGGVPLHALRAAAFDGGGAAGLDLQPQDIELAVLVSADFEA